jgi:hypothetical protein
VRLRFIGEGGEIAFITKAWLDHTATLGQEHGYSAPEGGGSARHHAREALGVGSGRVPETSSWPTAHTCQVADAPLGVKALGGPRRRRRSDVALLGAQSEGSTRSEPVQVS